MSAVAADTVQVTRSIEPVPEPQRRLGAFDLAVLWGDLGVGLLVLVAGALLVPGLSLAQAFAAIVIGSVVGSLLLALAGHIGTIAGVPTMVLTRSVLGVRGSYIASAINVLQLIGWATFEIFVMAQLASAILRGGIGVDTYGAWAFAFAALAAVMAIGGPLLVVRQWLKKFAVWVMLLTSAWLFVYVIGTYDVPALLAASGTGELAFWAAVDLVIAMPVSWFPLVADYNRFAKRGGASFWGTFAGYTIANAIFFALGALLVRALGTGPFELTGALVSALGALALGWLALVIILVDETDQAFANVYSTAVSIQNVLPGIPQRLLIIVVSAVAFVLALAVTVSEYEIFLFLIGACFVPLLGIVAADFFVVARRSYDVAGLYRRGGAYWYSGGFNVTAIVVWVLGFVVYQWLSPTPIEEWTAFLGGVARSVGLPFPLVADIGATVPSFAFAFVLYSLLARVAIGRATPAGSAV